MNKTLHIVKIGGKVINDSENLMNFLEQFSNLQGPKILVHGGGVIANRYLEQLQIPVQMIEGRRVTCDDTIEVVTGVYSGIINKKIVAQLNCNRCYALGVNGADGGFIISEKRQGWKHDYGNVGDITYVDAKKIKALLELDICLVFSSISMNKKGQLLNTNADTIAAELAIALKNDYKTKLIYCFEKEGLLTSDDSDGQIIKYLDFEGFKKMECQKTITDGMIPKLTNCFDALKKGVSNVMIGNGLQLNSILSGKKGTALTLGDLNNAMHD